MKATPTDIKNPYTRPATQWHPSQFGNWATSELGVTAQFVRKLLEAFFVEDHGSGCVSVWGGVSELAPQSATACIIAKEGFVLCGLNLMAEVFHMATDGVVSLYSDFKDGQKVAPGNVVLWAEGSPGALLLAERVALNLASALSGVSSRTNDTIFALQNAADQLKIPPPELLETRKTTPGLRLFEKYATRIGGARNHRHGLDSGAMLKENHLRAGGGIEACLGKLRSKVPVLTKIEVEVTNLEEFQQALEAGADVIMLDNFNAADIALAVDIKNNSGKQVYLEVSGNLDRRSPEEICNFRVDFVSMGALIHQARWVDMSMQMYATPTRGK